MEMKVIAAFLLIAMLASVNGAAIDVEAPSEVQENLNGDAAIDSYPFLVRNKRRFPSFGGGGSLSAAQALNFQGGVNVPVVGEIGGSFSGSNAFSGGAGFGFDGH